MTEIKNTWSFDGFPRIYLMTSDYKIRSLGLYDPDWARDTEFSYEAGKFTKPDGSPYDALYNGKQCMIVSFRHPIFGNYPGLRNIGGGHFHTKYIVSTSLIRPHEVLRADGETKDIILYADLAQDPPHTEERGDHTWETLYEITPHLTPEQLAQLPKEVKFATKMQEKMYRLESEKFDLKTKLILTESTAIAAQSSVILYREELKSAYQNHQTNEKKYLRLQLLMGEQMAEAVEQVESTHFLGAPWTAKNHDESTKLLASNQAMIRDMASMEELMGSPTDAQKWQVLMQAIQITGLPFAVKALRGMKQYETNTPGGGVGRLTISKEPSLIETTIQFQRLLENKQISPEDYDKAITEAVRQDQERRKRSDSPNSAIQESKRELMRTAGITQSDGELIKREGR